MASVFTDSPWHLSGISPIRRSAGRFPADPEPDHNGLDQLM
jgi:hypothetical protein